MNRRLLLAAALVALLAGLAGCSMFGPGDVDEAELATDADYEWDGPANSTFNVSRSQYRAVIRLNESLLEGENNTELRIHRRDSVGSEKPVDIQALKFRYPNGTVANASAFDVSKTRSRTVIVPPQTEGQVAFTAPRPSGKRFSVPVFLPGSHAVVLPPRARVGLPLLSQVSPRAEEKTVSDNRMTIYWADVERGPIVARYYLQRDLLLFGGLFAVLALVGIGGLLYYVRQIKVLERRREEIGLDVETEDDDLDDRGPPPGMR